MKNDEIAYVELIVSFGRNTVLVTFPYLGQAAFMGHLDALLAGSAAMAPRSFMSVCVSSAVGEYMDKALDERRLAEACRQGIPAEVQEMAFDAQDGIRMCDEICRLLDTPKAEQAGLRGIAAQLTDETSALREFLVAGGYRDLRFSFEIRECQQPPDLLVAWLQKDLAELGQLMGEIMDEVKQEKGGKV